MMLDLYDRVLQKYPEWIWDKNILDLIEKIKSEIPLIINNKKNEIYKKSEWNK